MAKVIYFNTLIYLIITCNANTVPMSVGVKRGVDTESGTSSCKADAQKQHAQGQDKASGIAEKAAKDAKAASDAQAAAGQQAALQVKSQLAEKAEEAAEAAEAALAGKQAVVDQITQEIQETEDFIKDESGCLPEAQQHVQAAVQTAALAAKGVEALKASAAVYNQLVKQADVAMQGAEAEVNEKQKLVEAAKKRVETLKAEYSNARQDLAKTKESETKAVQAATAAKENVSRNRRKSGSVRELPAKKRVVALTSNLSNANAELAKTEVAETNAVQAATAEKESAKIVEAQKSELSNANADLRKTEDAGTKVVQAANAAKDNASRNRRKADLGKTEDAESKMEQAGDAVKDYASRNRRIAGSVRVFPSEKSDEGLESEFSNANADLGKTKDAESKMVQAADAVQDYASRNRRIAGSVRVFPNEKSDEGLESEFSNANADLGKTKHAETKVVQDANVGKEKVSRKRRKARFVRDFLDNERLETRDGKQGFNGPLNLTTKSNPSYPN